MKFFQSLVSILVYCICSCGASTRPAQSLAAVDEQHYRAAVARDPRDPAAHAEYSRWLAAQQRHLEAEVEIRAAVNAEPSDAAYRADLASILAASDGGSLLSIKRAEEEFLEGIQRSESAEMRAAYAAFLARFRSADRAAAEYERAAAIAHAPSLRSECLLSAARMSAAAPESVRLRLYTRAVDAERSATTLAALAGFLRFVKRDYRRAEEAYAEAVELSPEDVDALRGYATFLHTIRRAPDRAAPMFARLVAADPSAAARDAHARFLLAQGEYAAAAAAAQEAVDQDEELRPAWAKVLTWQAQTPTWRDCARWDAAEVLACGLLVLAAPWS